MRPAIGARRDVARPVRAALATAALALAAVLLAALWPRVALAQDLEPVKVTAALGATTVQPGETAEVRFHLDVPAGQHVYPPDSTAGYGLSAKLEGDARGLTPEAPRPSAKPKIVNVPGIGKVPELDGSFDVVWTLKVAADAVPGKREIKATLTLQACDETSCALPASSSFPLVLDVLPPVSVGPPLDLPPAPPAHAGFGLEPATVAPGELVKVVVTFFVKPGFHIYAPGTEAGEEVKVEVAPPAGYALEGGLEAPPPTRTMDEPGLGKALIWEGNVKVSRSVRVPRDAAAGKASIGVKLRWSVCDENGCQTGKDSRNLELVVSGTPSSSSPAPTSPTPTPGASVSPAPQDRATADAPGFGALIATSVLAGIAMLFLPCTYPMIPVTISIFSKGQKLSPAETWGRAAIYAGGIVLSFTVVGGVVQAVFAAEGQNFVRQVATNGWLNLVIGALFVYFALSFFGYYEVSLPQFLNTFVNKGLRSARGKPGAGGGVPTIALFLMGSFFVLTSYTCGAPIVLGVLTVGAAVPGKLTVIAATAIFGATIALPFFFLALVPSAIQSLPKGGSWFYTFKVVLGTVELAASLKFFSNADLYWHQGAASLLTRPVFLAVWVGLAGFSALYCAGVLRFKHEEGPKANEQGELPPKLTWGEAVRGVPLLLGAAWLAAGLNGPLPAPDGKGFLPRALASGASALDAFLPPVPVEDKPGAPGHASFHVPARPSFDEALALARKAGKPLFLEFTGHT